MPRPRNAPAPQPTVASTAPKTRSALKEKNSNTRLVFQDAHHLIKDAKPKRGRQKKAQQDSDELVMGGGLGQQDEDSDGSNIQVASKPKPKSGKARKGQEVRDEGKKQEIGHPTSEAPLTTYELAKSDSPPPPTAKRSTRPPRATRKTVHNEAQSKVLEGLKQRMEATARGQKGKQTVAPVKNAQQSSDTIVASKATVSNAERSNLSLSPSPPPPGKLNVVKGPRSSIVPPGSALRAQATPAMESSLLALKNFKRRPRQPSMLQMVKQRTASAAPSVTHTMVESAVAQDSSVFDLDLSEGGEDDFMPEAEGTPLVKTVRKSSASVRGSVRSITGSTRSNRMFQKRKLDDIDDSLGSVIVKSAKRRRSGKENEQGRQHPVTQVPATQTSTDDDGVRQVRQGLATSEVQVVDSFSTSTPPTEPPSPVPLDDPSDDNDDLMVPSTERDGELDDHSEDEINAMPNSTMAEPLSSSPPHAVQPIDPILADPLTQLSPSPPPKKTTKPRQKSKPILTATLQSLLPKRRQPLKPRRRKSEYDLDSASDEEDDNTPLDVSHLDNDEDELGTRPPRQTKKKRAPKPSAASKRGRPSKVPASASKKASSAPARKSSMAPGPKTYGRQAVAAASDKENDEEYASGEEEEEEEGDFTLPEVSYSMEEAAAATTRSKEIEAAKKKFAEVDEWDFEFESMSAENHRSSSPTWR